MGRNGRAPDLARFLTRLRGLMEERGMTQKELAESVGVANATVTEWFKRGRSPLSEVLLIMPDALGVNGHWLLTGRGQREPPSDEAVEDSTREILEDLEARVSELKRRLDEE